MVLPEANAVKRSPSADAPAKIIHDASDLPSVIERARALLDDGDSLAAKILAAKARSDGVALVAQAVKMGASDRLVAKARRLQGDALLIETRALIAIADEWDGLKSAGLIDKGGRPSIETLQKAYDEQVEKPVMGNDRFSVSDFGLTKQELAEARKLREAEAREPGIAARAIAARVAAGLNPTKASLRANIGTKTASAEDRGDNLYETPAEAVHALLAVETFDISQSVLEPACGRMAISNLLLAEGFDVISSDLVDRGAADANGECQQVIDFLETNRGFYLVQTGSEERSAKRARAGGERSEPAVSENEQPLQIITNPPYGEAVLNRFVRHALEVHQPRKMALLLNLNFLCGCADADRQWIWEFAPPARVHVFSRRLPMMHRDGWDGPKASSSMNTAWFVWERVDADRLDDLREMIRLFPGRVDPDAAEEMLQRFPYGLRTETKRVDWKDYLPTGKGGKA